MYEMLAGRAPFQATNPHGYILKHVTEKPLPIGTAASPQEKPIRILVLNYGWYFIEKPFVAVQLVAKINEVLDEALRDQSTDHSIRAK